jgi:hypothetical protein
MKQSAVLKLISGELPTAGRSSPIPQNFCVQLVALRLIQEGPCRPF